MAWLLWYGMFITVIVWNVHDCYGMENSFFYGMKYSLLLWRVFMIAMALSIYCCYGECS